MSDSDTKGKNVRFRSACNYCHSLKVKCSGDKLGCQRCRELRQDCHYSISKVGKVPGVRSKAKSQQNSRSQSVPSTEPSFTPPQAKPFVGALPANDATAMSFADMDWSLDMPTPGLDPNGDLFHSGPMQHEIFPATMPAEFPFHNLPPLDASLHFYGHEQIPPNITETALGNASSQINPEPVQHANYSSTPSEKSYSSTQHPQDVRNMSRGTSISLSRTNSTGTGISQPSSASRIPLSDTNGRAGPFPLDDESAVYCILSCNQIIEDLNLRAARLRNGVGLPLDEMLNVNKTTVTTLTRIINLPAFAENTTCPVLVAVAMEQIAALFDACIAATPQLKQRPSRATSVDASAEAHDAMFPALTLGSFCVEEGLLTQIRKRIVCRELDRAIWALGQLADTSKLPKPARATGAPTHHQWAENIASKLRALSKPLNEEG